MVTGLNRTGQMFQVVEESDESMSREHHRLFKCQLKIFDLCKDLERHIQTLA